MLRRKKLRIEMENFRRELLGQEGKQIGRFDTRFCADHHYVIGTGAFDPATDDAATAGVNSAHLSGFHQHLAADLGYRSHLHYRPLNNVTIAAAWTGDTRRPASTRRSRCAEFDISHLYLSERLRRNVQFSWYESGHMTFADEKVIPMMTSDLARFDASAPEQVG